jgi:thymidylate kinase
MTEVTDNGGTQLANAKQEVRVLPLLLAVLNEFNSKNISYCYWKSTQRVHLALSGEADLDLLIAREDQHRAQSLLLQLGFKLFPCAAARDHPSTSSFLGYDEPSGQLVHLHLYFRLIVGKPVLKNYRIPWENEILAHSTRHQALPIRVLDRVSEALLLVVRSCLELSRLDPIAVRDWERINRKFALDHKELAKLVDASVLRARANALFGRDLADLLTTAFFDGKPLGSQSLLRGLIRRHFAACRTYNSIEAQLRSVGRTVLGLAAFINDGFLHLPRTSRRRAPGGGCRVAIVGLDGSGKSTVSSAMRDWLAPEVDVALIYFGIGDGRPSLFMRPFKWFVPIVTRLVRTKPKGASHGKISNEPPTLLYSVLLMVWATVVAHEKRVKLATSSRAANRGLVVITDRYPQDEIASFNDGPMLARLPRVPLLLRRYEASSYALAHRVAPDLVVKLVVGPEITARREPDMDSGVIGERIEGLKRLAFRGAKVICVDAQQPLPQVLAEVRREIWRLL